MNCKYYYILLVLLFGVTSCITTQEQAQIPNESADTQEVCESCAEHQSQPEADTKVLNPPESNDVEPVEVGESVTFLHLNDSYRIDEVRAEDTSHCNKRANCTVGGLGRVATVIKNLQGDGKNVQLLHGGDFLFPSLEGDQFGGRKMINALNFLHGKAPLTVVPGNHEFDKGEKIFVPAVKESDFYWVGSNVKFKTSDTGVNQKLEAVRWIKVGGHKVAIFGIVLSEEYEDYVEVSPTYLETSKKTIAALRAQGAKAIIALTHLEINDDRSIAKLKDVTSPLIWVASAHEHNSYFEKSSANQALITRGASNARSIWKFELSFDEQGKFKFNPPVEIKLDTAIAVDPEYKTLVKDPIRNELLTKMPFLTQVIGEAGVDLDGREEVIRTRESSWGNYITDKMKEMFPDSKVDFAFMNGGTIRIDDIIRGDITIEDVWRSFGFDAPVRYMQLSGKDFKKRVLDNAYSKPDPNSPDPAPGKFLQFSEGIWICVDNNKDKDDRIIAKLKSTGGAWSVIEDNDVLRVVAPAYISEGGDDYHFGEKAIIASPAAGEVKYFILGKILDDTANDQKIGEAVDPMNPRVKILPAGNMGPGC